MSHFAPKYFFFLSQDTFDVYFCNSIMPLPLENVTDGQTLIKMSVHLVKHTHNCHIEIEKKLRGKIRHTRKTRGHLYTLSHLTNYSKLKF